MSDMLFDEEPLLIPRSLAKALGVNEAIIVQQIHYWLKKKLHYYDGRYWTYNTYDDWAKQFEHLSPRSIRRYIKRLEDLGVLDSNQYNKKSYDHTKWYTINYETLGSYRPIRHNDVDKSGGLDLPNVDASITKNNTKTYKHIGEAGNVSLTEDEHTKLINRFGKDLTDRCIDKLSVYMSASPKKARQYKSHYSVILNWVVENILEHNPPKTLTKPQMNECEKKWSSIRGKYNYDRTSEIWVLK